MIHPAFQTLSLPREATPRAILSWVFVLLRGFPRCLRLRPLGEDTSPGVSAPSAYEEKRVHVSLHQQSSHPVSQATLAIPWSPATVPFLGFPNLTTVFSSLIRPLLFRQVTLLGFFPRGIYSFRAASETRRLRHALLKFIPPVALVLDLGENSRGRTRCGLG